MGKNSNKKNKTTKNCKNIKYLVVHFFAEKTCPKPDDSVLNDAILLSRREYFFYEEYITFRCNHGYALSNGNVEVDWRCKADQTWDNSLGDPQCQRKFSNRANTIEPRCEKTCPQDFRPGPTQTGLWRHRRWLEN